jgi:hypothetical protein
MVCRVRSLFICCGAFARIRSFILCVLGLPIVLSFAAGAAHAGADPAKTVGPNACGECHKQETEAWKESHHFKTFRDMPRSKDGNEIAKKMGLRRIKSESLCLTCHFTVQEKGGKEETIAGIS